jgi:predicted  nucleic acid-binding Zn-ribbon protein
MSDLNSYEKGLANDLAKAQVRIEELEAAFNNLHREYNSRGDRIAELEARLAKAVDTLGWAVTCWDDHNKYGYEMQGVWVLDARTTLAEIQVVGRRPDVIIIDDVGGKP